MPLARIFRPAVGDHRDSGSVGRSGVILESGYDGSPMSLGWVPVPRSGGFSSRRDEDYSVSPVPVSLGG